MRHDPPRDAEPARKTAEQLRGEAASRACEATETSLCRKSSAGDLVRSMTLIVR